MSLVPGSRPGRPGGNARPRGISVYPGYDGRGRRVDIVFAVYLQNRRPPLRAAVLDADTDEVLGRAGTRESAAI